MESFAALGWSLFVIAVAFYRKQLKLSEAEVLDRNHAIDEWRAENARVWGKLADSEQTVVLLEHEIERLTPKHGKDGKFVKREV